MTDGEKAQARTKDKIYKILKDNVPPLLLAVFIALTIRHFVIEPFKIPSGSMIPTLLVGDYIFVNKFKYGFQVPFKAKRFIKFKDPKKGEVVVFIFPEDKKKDFIKRVVGVAGDKIDFKDRTLYINDKPVAKTPAGEYIVTKGENPEKGDLFVEDLNDRKHYVMYLGRSFEQQSFEYIPCTVPEGYIFVMGDNRDNSLDSRSWGFVPLDNLKGEALFVWLSLDRNFDKIYDWVRWKRLFRAIR